MGNFSAAPLTIRKGKLTAAISPVGGELRSLCYGDCELIWQGDPDSWEGSAPLLFPFCGRVKNGVYRFGEAVYSMPIHGFLPQAPLTPTKQSDDQLTLTLTDTPETRALYPFPFRLTLVYRLSEDALTLTAAVEAGDLALPFSFGAHPGFNLPIAQDGFGNACLQFATDDPLTRIEITEEGLLGNGRTDYPLADGKLPLTPDPAGGCGIFFALSAPQRTLSLCADRLPCIIGMEFADFSTLGLWHAEGAPYLCIEPWEGLPAPADRPTDLADKPATVLLAPHETKTYTLRITLSEKG